MSQRLTVHVPINSVSFGHVSYCILHELWKRGAQIDLFPIGGNMDLSSFKAEPEFSTWLHSAATNALKNYKSTNPVLRLWHINGSHEHIGQNQYLFTFFECDQLTDTEKNILNNQKAIFVSSEETKKVFETYGVTTPIYYIPLGFDSLHFKQLNKRKYHPSVTVWHIGGKFERRKAQDRVIRLWLEKFGNNTSHMLHTMIYNPFFKPEDNQMIFNQICQGKKYSNVNPLPYVPTLSELNDSLNVVDIVLDLSMAEGWSLPSFHALGLGKHGIIHNATAMKGWANEDNAVLIEPIEKVQAHDGIFFHNGAPFNQGNFYNFSDNDLKSAFDSVLERKKNNPINEEGLKLQELFKWENSVDKILSVIEGK